MMLVLRHNKTLSSPSFSRNLIILLFICFWVGILFSICMDVVSRLLAYQMSIWINLLCMSYLWKVLMEAFYFCGSSIVIFHPPYQVRQIWRISQELLPIPLRLKLLQELPIRILKRNITIMWIIKKMGGRSPPPPLELSKGEMTRYLNWFKWEFRDTIQFHWVPFLVHANFLIGGCTCLEGV